MGLFGKKPEQPAGKSAADVFAARDKQPVETGDEQTAERILGYNTLKGAEHIAAQKTAAATPPPPVDRIEELRRIREARARGENYDDEQAKAKAALLSRADAADRSAASDAITARQNLLSSDGIKRREGPTEEERAAIEAKGMSTLGNITDGIKNKQFLTEVNEEIGEILGEKRAAAAQRPEDKNLNEDEVNAATSKFRNVGFFTETEVFEEKRKLTIDEELEELESAEKAMAVLKNVGFQSQVQKVDNLVGDALGDELGETPEEEGK